MSLLFILFPPHLFILLNIYLVCCFYLKCPDPQCTFPHVFLIHSLSYRQQSVISCSCYVTKHPTSLGLKQLFYLLMVLWDNSWRTEWFFRSGLAFLVWPWSFGWSPEMASPPCLLSTGPLVPASAGCSDAASSLGCPYPGMLSW